MRKITHIVVHCTATPQNTTLQSIQNYWKSTLKWRNPGYHYIVDASGMVHQLQPITKPSNGVRGHNANSIHISYIGGVDALKRPLDNRTPQQKAALLCKLRELKSMYPMATIQGHRDFYGVAKACPSFNAKAEYQNL